MKHDLRVLASLVLGLALLALAAGAFLRVGPVAVPHETGYLAPVFSPDGGAVFAVKRDARALVLGFGREFFTPPARVTLLGNRFELVSIRVADGRETVVEAFPASPLTGTRIRAYYGAIFGVPHAHLRWADATHLDYEIAVTHHEVPLSRTFVIRRAWNPASATSVTTFPWQEDSTAMGGDETLQLHGDLEVLAVPGEEMLPCAIALLRRDGSAAAPLVETATCRRRYPSGISPAILSAMSRRADIERAETIRTTYADLVARGRAAGRSEGQAMLDAGKEMQRLGLYPRTTTLVAAPVDCNDASPVFSISDMEFTVGLFSDIEAAIAKPGVEVNKSMGAYITHDDYTTSRHINQYVEAGHSVFVVRARGACWQMTIQRP